MGSVKHDFEEQRFANLTKCFVCDEMIENEVITGVLEHTPGLLKRQIPEKLLSNYVPRGIGCTCRVCGVNVHKSCSKKIRSPCAKVYHKFELRSYPPFSKMCYACGTTLHGLYNQGYRCSACGIDCHAGCRTNINIKFCEAAPQSYMVEDEAEEGQVANEGEKGLYEFADDEGDGEHGAKDPEKRSTWRNSLSKRITSALSGGASAAATMAANLGKPKKSSTKAKPIQIPSSLVDMGKELRKLHTQSRAVAMISAEKWEQEELPKLKQSRTELTKHKGKLRFARDKLASKVDRRAKKRTAYYRAFLLKVLTKHAKKKKSDAERIAAELLDRYSKHRCREDEMLEQLLEIVPTSAHDMIKSEIENGPCRPDGKLEKSLMHLEQLHEQVQLATQSLEAVRRELYFPRWKHWFARLGLEGTYVALGTLWMEQFQGSMGVRLAMFRKTKKNDQVVPTLVIGLGGHDTVFNFDEMGSSPAAAKQREKSGSMGGMRLVCRVEQLSVSASSLNVSFTLDQLSLDVEFFLNIEVEYIESRKRNIKGVWRLKPNSFSMKFKRFELNFKGGSINIPDALLRTVVKNLMSTLAKQAVVSALPPEFGEYLLFMHANLPETVRTDHEDIFRYHGRIDVAAEVDLETLDYTMEGPDGGKVSNGKKSNGLVRVTKSAMKGAAKFAAAAVGASSSTGKKHAFKDVPVVARVSRALGLDEKQMHLLIRTQQELGLTKDSLFPDESLHELGMKAIYANVQDLQASVEAANKLGMRVLAGDLLSTEVPLRTLLDLVSYVLTYFGPGADDNVYVPRMVALWQGALDRTLKKMEMGVGLDSRRDWLGDSTNSLGSTPGSEAESQAPSSPRFGGGGVGGVGRIRAKRIVFTDLVERILQLARKRVISHLEVVHTDITIALEHLLKVGRDKMIRAAVKTRGGNAMVFQLQNTQQQGSGVAEGEDYDDYEDPLDESDSFKMDAETSFNQTLTKVSSSLEDDEEDDDDEQELKELLLESGVEGSSAGGNGTLIGYGEKQRRREAQIQARYERQTRWLVYVRQKLLKDISFQVLASAGEDRFDLRFLNIDLVSPVDFRLSLGSSIFSNQSRINSWPWRRVMRSEGAERMHMAIIRVKDWGEGPGTESYSDPDSQDALHVEFSSIESRMETEGEPSVMLMNVNLEPDGPDKSSWSEPGKVHFHWKGKEDLRFIGSMDLLQVRGGLGCLQDYASDMLNWSMQAFSDKRIEKMYQFMLRTLIRYAKLNTFSGNVCGEVVAATTEEDTFIRIFNNPVGGETGGSTRRQSRAREHPKQGRGILNVELEHNFVDLTDDVAQFLQAFVTGPISQRDSH